MGLNTILTLATVTYEFDSDVLIKFESTRTQLLTINIEVQLESGDCNWVTVFCTTSDKSPCTLGCFSLNFRRVVLLQSHHTVDVALCHIIIN